jgi:hypothetical protein
VTGPGPAEIARLLASTLHDAIAAELPAPVGTGPGATTVLFESPGRAVAPADFTKGNAVANRQAASLFVDRVPAPGTTFVEASYSFSSIYGELAGSAQPASTLTADEQAVVAKRVANARKLVENSKIGMVGGPAVSYLPTDQAPVTWWDAAGPQWSTLRTADSPPPPANPPITPPQLSWYMAAKRGEGPPIIPPPPEMFAAIVDPPTTVPTEDSEAAAQPAPSTSTDISVQLDYCYVTLRRAWLDPLWFRGPGWAIPGYGPNSIAAGNPAADGQLLAATPVGFVAMKNVAISANWSAADMNLVPDAVSYGPFRVEGAGFTGSDTSANALAATGSDASTRATLQIPGTQIIAWACEIPQAMPPAQP